MANMKYISPVFAALMVFSTTSLADTPSVSATDRAITVEEKEFSPAFPGNDEVHFAAAFGDRDKGAHGTFGKFPANFETTAHIHTHSYRAIVLEGEMTNPFDGEKNPPILRPGAYWEVVGGSIHTTACVSDTPCQFFMFGDDSFDFIPAGE